MKAFRLFSMKKVLKKCFAVYTSPDLIQARHILSCIIEEI
jgi:hypothetical protein